MIIMLTYEKKSTHNNEKDTGFDNSSYLLKFLSPSNKCIFPNIIKQNGNFEILLTLRKN